MYSVLYLPDDCRRMRVRASGALPSLFDRVHVATVRLS